MFELLIVVICLILNALLAAIEMAFVASSSVTLRDQAKKGTSKANKLLEMKNNPERILSVIQVGITLVGAIAAAVGGAGAEGDLTPYLKNHFELSQDTAKTISLCLIVIPLTYFSVVFGELLPKAIALRNPIKLAYRSLTFLRLADKCFGPLVSLLETNTKFLLRLLKIRTDHLGGSDDPEKIANYAIAIGIDRRITVKEVMIPMDQVISIHGEMKIEEVAKVITDSGHTRLPVWQEGQIIGALNSKDFNVIMQSCLPNWAMIIRDAVFIDENVEILDAFKKLQKNRQHMGIVTRLDVPIGIATMEDILEEFLGEIYDEDDDNLARKLFTPRIKKSNGR